MEQIAAPLARALDKCKIFAIADGKIDLDGIELGHRSQHGLRAYEVSDLGRRLPGHTRNQRTHLRKAEIQLRGVDCGLRGLHRGFGLRFC